MHILHIIAVEADDAEDAISCAESALEGYGDGRVWDWYEVGGRWQGALGGENTLCYADNPELWEQTMDAVFKRMDRTFVDLKNRISGKQITEEDVEDFDNVFGLPIADKAAYVEKNNEVNLKYAEAFNKIMERTSVPRTIEAVGEESMAAWTMSQLCKLISGEYSFDTPFFDGVTFGVWRGDVDARCAESPGQQWMVAIDIHN